MFRCLEVFPNLLLNRSTNFTVGDKTAAFKRAREYPPLVVETRVAGPVVGSGPNSTGWDNSAHGPSEGRCPRAAPNPPSKLAKSARQRQYGVQCTSVDGFSSSRTHWKAIADAQDVGSCRLNSMVKSAFSHYSRDFSLTEARNSLPPKFCVLSVGSRTDTNPFRHSFVGTVRRTVRHHVEFAGGICLPPKSQEKSGFFGQTRRST